MIAAGGRYESLLQVFRSPFGQPLDDLNCVGMKLALSKIISSISHNHSQQAQLSADIGRAGHINRAQVVVLCLGTSRHLYQAKLKICALLWNSGISCELDLHDLVSMQDEYLTTYRSQFRFAVIVKQKGVDAHIIKLRIMSTRSELEVSAQDLVATIQSYASGRGPKRESADSEVPPVALENLVYLSKKAKGVRPREKSLNVEQCLAATNQGVPIILVDLTWAEVIEMHSYWLKTDDTFRSNTLRVKASKEYLFSIKRYISKLVSESPKYSFIWIFSTIESKAHPLVF